MEDTKKSDSPVAVSDEPTKSSGTSPKTASTHKATDRAVDVAIPPSKTSSTHKATDRAVDVAIPPSKTSSTHKATDRAVDVAIPPSKTSSTHKATDRAVDVAIPPSKTSSTHKATDRVVDVAIPPSKTSSTHKATDRVLDVSTPPSSKTSSTHKATDRVLDVSTPPSSKTSSTHKATDRVVDVSTPPSSKTSSTHKATDRVLDKGNQGWKQPATKKSNWIPQKDFKSTAKLETAPSKGETPSGRDSFSSSDDRRKNRFRPRKRVLNMRDLHIDYKDPEVLSRFISRTGKILPTRAIGSTARVQRKIARAIKAARHIGLLPYSNR